MNENIKAKMKEIHDLANKSTPSVVQSKRSAFRTNNSLLEVIRNKEEADIFMAELNAVIAIGKKK